MRGEQFFKKVVAIVRRIYPGQRPVFSTFVEMVINSIRYHGKKSLTLNCTCMPRLSSDELDLITSIGL